VYQEREYGRALIRRRQSAVVADILYRVLTGQRPTRHEQADMRRRATQGTSVAEMVQELRTTPQGSKMTVNLIGPALRSYLRTQFDPATGVSITPRVVHLHIMKTGGTSVSHLLAQWFGPDRARIGIYLDDLVLCPPPVLANSAVIAGHLPFAALPLIPPPYHTLVVLRDPFARTLSHFTNLRHANPLFRGLSLEQFVFDGGFQLAGNVQARYLAHDIDLGNAWRSWSPEHRLASIGGDPLTLFPLQALFDSGETGQSDEELLENAKRNLDRIDFVGITDALGDIAARLATRFGFPQEQVPRLNAASEPLNLRDVSSKIRRRIDERTAVDRELYDLAKQRAHS